MADGIHILLKRAKNYQKTVGSVTTDIAGIADRVLEYGEPLYLVDLKYLVIGDGENDVKALIETKHQYYTAVNNTTLYDIAKYAVDIDLDDTDTYKIANLGFTRTAIADLRTKLITGFTDGKGAQDKTLTAISYNTETEKFTVTFSKIYIDHTRITDWDTAVKAVKVSNAEFTDKADKVKVYNADTSDTTYYILGSNGTSDDYNDLYRANAAEGTANKNGIRFQGSTGVLMGAAWNDFAEYRKCQGKPGTVVCETGKGDLVISSERLQAGAAVISDTCGMIIGPEGPEYQPIAVAGRVLVNYMGNINQYKAGDAVCAAQFGRIDKMSREEIKEYPDRILGYVSEIPTYDNWNNIKVNNRIWIKLR